MNDFFQTVLPGTPKGTPKGNKITTKEQSSNKKSKPPKFQHPGIIRDRPMVMVLAGMKGSGKTTMCIDLLTNELCGVFDDIIIISPTIKHQDCWNKIDMSDITIYESVDDRILQALYNERCANYKTSNMLCIFDDLGQDLRPCDLKLLNRIISNSRHLKLSCMFLHQRATQCSPIIRSQTDTYIIFSSSSYSERESLYKEVSVVDRKHFAQIMGKATDQKFGCLICSKSHDGRMIMYDRQGTVLL